MLDIQQYCLVCVSIKPVFRHGIIRKYAYNFSLSIDTIITVITVHAYCCTTVHSLSIQDVVAIISI